MIAIVGNSGSVLEHDHGKLIDSHDTIIRFNEAPVKGFERFVGGKTDKRYLVYNDTLEYDLTGENIYLYSYNLETQIEGYNKLNKENQVTYLDKEFIQKCDNMISKPYWKWRFLPNRIIIHKKMSSTGFKAVMYFKIFPDLHLFGFNHCEKYHYWVANDKIHGTSINHNWDKEKRIIKNLENEGRLKIFS